MTCSPSIDVANLTPVQLQTRYKAWADALTYEMALSQADAELRKARKTTFTSILRTLHHVYIVEEIFRAHLREVEHSHHSRSSDTPPAIDELHQNVQTMNTWWVDYVDGLSAHDFSQPVRFKFVDGTDGVMTRQEIICHVVQHATYHRGYVDDMMYHIPVTPPATDYPIFLRQLRRAAAHPDAP